MRRGLRVRSALWASVLAAGVVGLVVAVLAGRGAAPARVEAHPAPIDAGAATRLADPAPGRCPNTPCTTAAAGPPAAPSGREPTMTPDAPAGPVEIEVPAAHIDASVVPVGTDPDGGVTIPADVGTVGWYRFSPPPGSAEGSTVLVGHVDSARQGAGAFFPLSTLTTGDEVTLGLPSGQRRSYRVVSREQFAKGDVPLPALFATSGAPRLTLITCGGSFDEARRSYRDNLVVTAVPR